MNASGTHAGWIVKHVEIPFQTASTTYAISSGEVFIDMEIWEPASAADSLFIHEGDPVTKLCSASIGPCSEDPVDLHDPMWGRTRPVIRLHHLQNGYYVKSRMLTYNVPVTPVEGDVVEMELRDDSGASGLVIRVGNVYQGFLARSHKCRGACKCWGRGQDISVERWVMSSEDTQPLASWTGASAESDGTLATTDMQELGKTTGLGRNGNDSGMQSTSETTASECINITPTEITLRHWRRQIKLGRLKIPCSIALVAKYLTVGTEIVHGDYTWRLSMVQHEPGLGDGSVLEDDGVLASGSALGEDGLQAFDSVLEGGSLLA